MSKRRLRNESFENLDRVVHNDHIPEVEGVMGVVMADAVQTHAEVNKHLQSVKKELEDRAKPILLDPPGTGNPVKTKYTQPLKLDESIEDFNLKDLLVEDTERVSTKVDGRQNKVTEEDDEDPHLDYDMFNFLYALFRGLEGNANRNPKNPLGHTIHTFNPNAADDYVRDIAMANEPQLTASGYLDRIYLSNDDRDYFADAIAICDLYQIKYSGPNPKKSKADHWNFTMTVFVPMAGPGYPMMLSDYMESIGKTVADVMSPEFTKTYNNKMARIEKEQAELLQQKEVEKMVNKAITVAANDNEPLENHLKQLLKDLRAAGLKFKRADVVTMFMSAFEDEDIDED